MKQAVETIIKSLVGDPDAVEVSEMTDGKNVRIEVRVADSDMGRIIARPRRRISPDPKFRGCRRRAGHTLAGPAAMARPQLPRPRRGVPPQHL